ncbi:MAG TPA: hypothetical protein VFC65_20585 [Prolixibacteraceae bacterium]|nr:hypothetical protein [Prolixibacteraceae bacterium]
MEKKQINKLRMFGSVDLVLKNHSQLFTQLEDLVLAHATLQDGLVVLGRNRQVQETDNSGLTDTKTDLRTNLVNLMFFLSVAIKSYANSMKDMDLKAKANYSKAELKQSPDPVLYDIGILLVNLASPILPELSKYFVSSEKITELNALLSGFNLAIPQKRVANSVSKVSTGNIGEVIVKLSKLLKGEIDVLMRLFEESQPDFYKAYKNARIIVDYSGRGPSGSPEAQVPEPMSQKEEIN